MAMKLTAMTTASAIVWGAAMLLAGLFNIAHPSYGTEFLRVMSSLYPGFHASRTFGDVIVGTIYGLVDGAIAGLIFGAIYRWVAGTGHPVSAGSDQNLDTPLRRAS